MKLSNRIGSLTAWLAVIGCLFFVIGCGQSTTTTVARSKSKQLDRSKPIENNSKGKDSVEHALLTETDQEKHAKEKTGPNAVLEGPTTHDFGSLDPFATGEHTFFIRNTGTEPLVLRFGDITCACAETTLPKDPIQPGQLADVIVSWRTKDNIRRFTERVQVKTNDPNRPAIDYWIQGDVRIQFGAEPPALTIPVARPGRVESVTTTLSSQVWNDFKIVDIETSLEGLKWETKNSSQATIDRLKVKSAKELTVSLPDTLPQGSFSHWVKIKIASSDGTEKEYELPLKGKVGRRVAVYGKGIDATGTVRLGVIPKSQGLKHKLFVKVRDNDTNLNVNEIVTAPDFVKVNLTPYLPKKKKGIYTLELEIPKGTTPCNHIANRGSMKIGFDHPRIDSLELRLEFAVSSPIASRR